MLDKVVASRVAGPAHEAFRRFCEREIGWVLRRADSIRLASHRRMSIESLEYSVAVAALSRKLLELRSFWLGSDVSFLLNRDADLTSVRVLARAAWLASLQSNKSIVAIAPHRSFDLARHGLACCRWLLGGSVCSQDDGSEPCDPAVSDLVCCREYSQLQHRIQGRSGVFEAIDRAVAWSCSGRQTSALREITRALRQCQHDDESIRLLQAAAVLVAKNRGLTLPAYMIRMMSADAVERGNVAPDASKLERAWLLNALAFKALCDSTVTNQERLRDCGRASAGAVRLVDHAMDRPEATLLATNLASNQASLLLLARRPRRAFLQVERMRRVVSDMVRREPLLEIALSYRAGYCALSACDFASAVRSFSRALRRSIHGRYSLLPGLECLSGLCATFVMLGDQNRSRIAVARYRRLVGPSILPEEVEPTLARILSVVDRLHGGRRRLRVTRVTEALQVREKIRSRCLDIELI